MRVRRHAAAEKAGSLRSCDERVPGARGDQDRVTCPHVLLLAADLEATAALDQKVDLLAQPVIVALRGLARRERRLSERLSGRSSAASRPKWAVSKARTKCLSQIVRPEVKIL